MSDVKHNFITFKPTGGLRVYLTLQGDWVVSGGLQPNINVAVIPQSEFDSLGGDLVGLHGEVEFWYTADVGGVADWSIDKVTIVDVEEDLVGKEPGESAASVKSYRIALADFRHGFVEPRGGRLLDGLLNPEPLGAATLLDNSELIDKCIDVMGGAVSIATTVDDVHPARNLQWNGVHAPTELGRLLQHTGHVYCIGSAGLAAIAKPEAGTVPTPPTERLLEDVVAPRVDRRGKTVIITSAPTALTHTWGNTAAEPPAWTFVCQDPADDFKWKPLATVFGSLSNAKDAVNNGFRDQDDEFRHLFDQQAFCCIQLDTTAYPPGKVSILKKIFMPDGVVYEPHFQATIAQQDNQGAWVNREVTLIAKNVITEENILVFEQRIGTVASSERADRDPFFVHLGETNLKPRYSVEAWDATNERKQYAVFGFEYVDEVLEPMEEAAAAAKLGAYDPDCVIYQVPDLREIHLNADTDNRADLETIAQGIAAPLVASAPETKILRIKGFWGTELSGRVSEIRFSQSEVLTTIVIDGWHAPSAAREAIGQTVEGSIPSDSKQTTRFTGPAEKKALPKQQASGAAGVNQPVEPANGNPARKSGTRTVLLKIGAAVASNAGRNTSSTISGKINHSASGTIALANIGTATTDDVVSWFPLRVNYPHADLVANQIVMGEITTTNAAGKPIVLVQRPVIAGELFRVKLTQTGGSNGNKTTAATWTYTVNSLKDVQLATGASPEKSREFGTRTAATIGVGYYTEAGSFVLYEAHEKPGTGGC